MLAGGGTLYLYALGMGIPLVVVTLFGNKLIPRSGPWMQYVKEAFGFVILALPVFYWKGCWGMSGVYVYGACWPSRSLAGRLY